MGKKNKENKKKQRTGTQKPEFRFSLSDIASTIHNETVMFILGAAVTVASLFIIIAYISFIFNGGIDQSVIVGAADDVANSTGMLGARTAELFVNRWFGLPVVLLPILTTIIGLKMMGIASFKIVKWTITCIFLTVWLSLFLQMTLAPLMRDSFIIPGGMHGRNLYEFLQTNIGLPGIILLLGFTMLIYCISVTRSTITWFRGRADQVKQGIHKMEDLGSSLIGKNNAGAGAEETQDTDDAITAGNSPVQEEEDEEEEDDDDPRVLSWLRGRKKAAGKQAAETAVQDVAADGVPESTQETVETPAETESTAEVEQTAANPAVQIPAKEAGKQETASDNISMTISGPAQEDKAEGKIQEPYDPRLDLSHYKFPTLDLLKHYDNDRPAVDQQEQNDNKERIITVLRNFGIEISTIQATVGPTITLYEITPAAGVRISKIKNLEADIALSLAALGIRIIAPIPGKGTIGIEVPNKRAMMVSMESILNTKKFAEADQKMELPMALGRTITNEVYIQDLAAMPHLLVAGATGQGKSVGLNCIITSLLYKKHPAELKLVMVDPKMVEFSIYAPIVKHFLAKLPDEDDAIITDTTKVVHTLKSLCIEMDNRYELLKQANVRSVKEYNELFKSRKLNPEKGHRFLPYIVVIIDEYGDLIMTAGKDIEMPIARIAQKARAVGMHMIIATQRPTANIITGTIKANFPARMAFRVSSMIDSRTILDRPGANQLVGRGDMLFIGKSGEPERVQCAFVDTPEVNGICHYISSQQGYTDAYPLPEYVDENDAAASDTGIEMGKFDPMFAEAARLVVSNQLGSTSLIQRKFSIGYNRAGRLMDQLEKTGIVGKQDGSKPRQVLVMDDTQLDRILEAYNLL